MVGGKEVGVAMREVEGHAMTEKEVKTLGWVKHGEGRAPTL